MSAKRTSQRKDERRRMPRADARLSMRVVGAPPEGDTTHIVTESQNISASGVYCYASHYLAPLSKVALTLILPRMPGGAGQELLKCEGIVVRCESTSLRASEKQFELACMFSDLDDAIRMQIEEFVTWRNLQALREAARSAGTGGTTRAKRAPARKRTGSATTAAKGTRRRTVH